MAESDPLCAWLRILLGAANLREPDGRPLYKYRISDENFQALERLLRERLSHFECLDGLVDNAPLPAVFLIYAAEWWRRRYDGHGMTYQTILADLGAEDKRWRPLPRGECIRRGLRYWNLEQPGAGVLCYLRAIALQGGLPLHLLALQDTRLRLVTLLTRVLHERARVDVPGSGQVRSWVEAQQHNLPQMYRQDAIYDLLTELIESVYVLVRDAQINEAVNDPIQRLNKHFPTWRDRFPLPIDDEQAQGLIERLIRGAGIRPPRPPLTIGLERWLEPQDETNWVLCASLDTPDRMTNEQLRQLFNIDQAESLPRTLQVRQESAGGSLDWAAQRLAGQGAYRIVSRPLALEGEAASREQRLRLIAPDSRSWSAQPRKGEELDPDLPWLFVVDAAGTPRWVRQGGGGIGVGVVLVALPEGWHVQRDDGAPIHASGRLATPSRETFTVQGSVTVTAIDGCRFRIRTDQEQAAESDFHWAGDRLWDFFIAPSMAFRGRPRLFNNGQAVQDKNLTWRPDDQADCFGPHRASYTLEGEEIHRARLVLLPQGARISLNPVGPEGGEIRLEGWQAEGASVTGQGIAAEVSNEGRALVLRLTWQPPADAPGVALALPPEWVEATLTWPQNPTTARLRLPFPARGVHAFDGQGRALTPNAWLPIHRLAGVRLVAVGAGMELAMWLRLQRPNQPRAPAHVRIPLRVAPGQSRVEVRLQDFATDIDLLLAADDLLDAWVEASLCAGPDDLFYSDSLATSALWNARIQMWL